MKKRNYKIQLQEHQLNPDTLTQDNVQYWSDSGIFLSVLNLNDAKERVSNKAAFCIGDHAITRFNDEYYTMPEGDTQ